MKLDDHHPIISSSCHPFTRSPVHPLTSSSPSSPADQHRHFCRAQDLIHRAAQDNFEQRVEAVAPHDEQITVALCRYIQKNVGDAARFKDKVGVNLVVGQLRLCAGDDLLIHLLGFCDPP